MRRVDPGVYDKSYYLTDCNGYSEFKQSWGKQLEPRTAYLVQYLRIEPGMKILDFGCGRGELAIWAASQGAEVWGIDYSAAAIKLAKQALRHYPPAIRKNCHFLLQDAKQLKFAAASFDAVFSLEVMEHLYPEEQDQIMAEVARVLRPAGYVFIHTAPAKWFNDFTYRYYCYPVSSAVIWLWKLFTKRSYPNLPPWSQIRTSSHLVMHVAEPDYFSLRRLFNRHGLTGAINSTNITIAKPILSFKDSLYNALVYLLPLSRHFPVNILFGHDYYAVLHKQ